MAISSLLVCPTRTVTVDTPAGTRWSFPHASAKMTDARVTFWRQLRRNTIISGTNVAELPVEVFITETLS